MVQLVSQVAPPSGEKGCSQWAEVRVICDQRKRIFRDARGVRRHQNLIGGQSWKIGLSMNDAAAGPWIRDLPGRRCGSGSWGA
jgi:hypothetical protein